MLVLNRKEGESLLIGDDIEITFSHLSGNRVQVCIDAPKSVRILRGELRDRLQAEDETDEEQKEDGSRLASNV